MERPNVRVSGLDLESTQSISCAEYWETALQFHVEKIKGSKATDSNGFEIDHAEMVKCFIAGIEYKSGSKAPVSDDA